MTLRTKASESLAQAQTRLRGFLEHAQSDAPFIRFEMPIPPLDPLAWLASQAMPQKVYWSDRDGREACAGAGIADLVRYGSLDDAATGRMALELPDGMRYYGGFTFAPGESPEWREFGAGWFVLPRFEVMRRGYQFSFACNVRNDGKDGDAAVASAMALAPQFTRAGLEEIPAPLSRRDYPSREAWMAGVEAALEAIRSETLEKVVLARRSELRFATPVNATILLMRLLQHTHRAYGFLFQPQTDMAFIGASPERLFSRRGGRVFSEALAGTRPAGDSTAESNLLARELLADPKERWEHALVVNSVCEVLAALCVDPPRPEETRVLKAPGAQHLHSRITGRLREGISDFEIVRALHPTPAVGGCPLPGALALIERLEPFHRGWYAGPVGWVGRDASEFAVGIRSALVQGQRVSLYAGAGIVEGSQPASEWDEVETKMGNLLAVVNGHDLRRSEHQSGVGEAHR